ncbi:1-deoxy-D-xylulose 5-phosphate reductoisomerase [Brockia lithotrophica]|uniref:1-deoxy-D-xylulose 5-phosphate reductoisomerase n=2 Tax=Brockia lithotrophica TaxID=933949 RepID=A0A660KZV9_9BACL|nr:1-deoxy-D-xylulose-5-phosphate reductoisomerase [Brockia lithotrophica]RKQ84222.1 1-deoxy-D-xylulose 5-phosphate reductoisomerase [Brockia lithotrophica]
MRRVVILGSTGSIGVQTLQVLAEFPESFEVVGLAAARSAGRLAEQVCAFGPRAVAVLDGETAEALAAELAARRCSPRPEILVGEEGYVSLAEHPDADVVVSALVGFSGAIPTLAAAEAGKTIALANKEALVATGELLLAALSRGGGRIVPVDSEHSAVYQALAGEPRAGIRRLILTASGGAFRHLSREELVRVTAADALRHPNWAMGPKVTIDSATMMNKALEVIEAHFLFDVPYEAIDVLLHDESIVHAMVEFQDGNVKAVLSVPDMRFPIQYALFAPERPANSFPRLDLARVGTLHFRAASCERYPALCLGYRAGKAGGTYPAVLSAANEVAVQALLEGRLGFHAVEDLLAAVLDAHVPVAHPTLTELREADRWAREEAARRIARAYSG